MTHNGLGQRVTANLYLDYPSSPDVQILKSFVYDEAGHLISERRSTAPYYDYIYLDDMPIAFVVWSGATVPGVDPFNPLRPRVPVPPLRFPILVFP